MKMAAILRCCIATAASSSQHALIGVSRSTTASQRLVLSLSTRCMSGIPPVSKTKERLMTLQKDLNDQTSVRTLALYKQLRFGTGIGNRPGMLDVVRHSRSDANKAVTDMSQEEESEQIVHKETYNVAEETPIKKYTHLLVKWARRLVRIVQTIYYSGCLPGRRGGGKSSTTMKKREERKEKGKETEEKGKKGEMKGTHFSSNGGEELDQNIPSSAPRSYMAFQI
ncbi:unnamed protein product [Meganyctiphanes norvegica]|uniref:ACB domain-containing protein n=1 Tax=Meganyctiphanes norvegica TaxID=48144 RepID=A0AAV2PM50_MEGNR